MLILQRLLQATHLKDLPSSMVVSRILAVCSALFVYLSCAVFLIFVVPAAPPAGYPPQGPPQQYGGQSHSCCLQCLVCVSVMRSISYFCCSRSASCRLPTSRTSPAVWWSVAFLPCAVSCCGVLQYCSFARSSSTRLPSSVLKNVTSFRVPSAYDDVPFVAFEVKHPKGKSLHYFSCLIPHFALVHCQR
jgi:hypothetical protein